MKNTILISLSLFYSIALSAQIESNKWLLSNNNVICFDTEITVCDHPENIIRSREGSTMVMNNQGEILFSVTGTAVYNSEWDIIKNGDNLTENTIINAAQSPVVLQKPGSETLYYAFYTEDHSIDEKEGDLKYSIINICDENGELSIASMDKNIKIEGDFSERLHLVEIDQNNYWLLTTSLFEKRLLAYKITVDGISDTPVESYVDSRFDGQIGKIVVSHDKTMLAWASTFTNTSGLSIFDFDIATGKISNGNKIDSREIYGIEWSLSDDYLYYTDIFSGSGVYSYSIETDISTQLFSRGGNYQVGDIKLSPNKDRIIVAQTYNNKLAEILNVETGGSYSELDLNFLGEIDMRLGLQQQVIHYGFDLPSINFTNEALTISEGEDFTELSLNEEFTDVLWSDGQIGNTATFYEAGVYQVEAYYNCKLIQKEFEISKEIIFEQDCDYSFDGSSLEEGLLLKVDFTDPIQDNSANNFSVTNKDVEIMEDRFGDNTAGLFGEEKHLRFENNEDLKPQFPMSFSFWVKQEQVGLNWNYVYTSDLQLDRRAGFAIAFSASENKLLFFYSDENGCYNPSCRRTFTSVDPIEAGEWKHISIVVKSYKDAEFYIDGCQIPLEYSGPELEDLLYSDKSSYIGFADNSSISNDQRAYFGGKIDDFYFWNRSITEEEIFNLYDRFEVPSIELQDVYTINSNQNEINIELSAEYNNVMWSDGQEGNVASFSEDGTYQVEAFFNCHLVCSEFIVETEIINPPADSCAFIQYFDSHCGTSRYHCVVPSSAGNLKYYFEGQIELPLEYNLCSSDLNDVISSEQEIYVFEMRREGSTVDFRAFATILDFDSYLSNGLEMEISICKDIEETCITYIIPYGTCKSKYDCTIDFNGITYRNENAVNINYGMVLHDLSNELCSSNYSFEAYLMNSTSEKLIYTNNFSESLNFYTNVEIPLSVDDFLSNDYNCIELRLQDNCTGESCYRYDCNLFNVGNSRQASIDINDVHSDIDQLGVAFDTDENEISLPYPNPTSARLSIDASKNLLGYQLRSIAGEGISVPSSIESDVLELDLSELPNGVYFLTRIFDNHYLSNKIIKID